MPLLLGEGGLGAVDRLARDLEIDERIRRKRQSQLAATGERSGGKERPELREQGTQCGVRRGRRPLWPEGPHELVATDRAEPVQDEVADQQTGLSTAELVVDALPVDLDRESAAELDSDLVCQGRAKIRPTRELYKSMQPRRFRWPSRSIANAGTSPAERQSPR